MVRCQDSTRSNGLTEGGPEHREFCNKNMVSLFYIIFLFVTFARVCGRCCRTAASLDQTVNTTHQSLRYYWCHSFLRLVDIFNLLDLLDHPNARSAALPAIEPDTASPNPRLYDALHFISGLGRPGCFGTPYLCNSSAAADIWYGPLDPVTVSLMDWGSHNFTMIPTTITAARCNFGSPLRRWPGDRINTVSILFMVVMVFVEVRHQRLNT